MRFSLSHFKAVEAGRGALQEGRFFGSGLTCMLNCFSCRRDSRYRSCFSLLSDSSGISLYHNQGSPCNLQGNEETHVVFCNKLFSMRSLLQNVVHPGVGTELHLLWKCRGLAYKRRAVYHLCLSVQEATGGKYQ
jgi:hypothetical protein